MKTKTLRVKSSSREVKRRAEDLDTPNKSMDVRAKQPLFKNLRGYLRLVRRRFCPTSSQSFGVSCWLNMQGYQCSTCGEYHSGLPFSYGSPAPAPYFDIPESERDTRVLLSSDQCVIDNEHFFVLGRLEISVLDAPDENLFSWNVWVSLSEKNFNRATELWEVEGRESEPSYFGWLSTSLPCYDENTFLLKTNVHTRPIGERPFIELEPTEHPLAVEQRNGITLKRVQEIAECALHS